MLKWIWEAIPPWIAVTMFTERKVGEASRVTSDAVSMTGHLGKAAAYTLRSGSSSSNAIALPARTSERWTITARDSGSTTMCCPPCPLAW